MTLTLNKKILGLIGVAIAMFVTAFAIFFSQPALASVLFSQPTLFNQHVETSMLVATTTTATSTNSSVTADRTVRLDGAERALFIFGRGDTKGTGNSGSTAFKVEVSLDGNVWYSYNTLEQNLATSTDPTAVSTVSLAGTSTAAVYMRYPGAWHFARCISVETTDGEASCTAAVDY